MGRTKKDDFVVDMPYDSKDGSGQVQEQLGTAEVNQSDRMAKARAAKRAGGGNGQKIAKAISPMTWYLLGLYADDKPTEVIGVYANRHRLMKSYRSMLPMIGRLYARVMVIRGKEIDVDSL